MKHKPAILVITIMLAALGLLGAMALSKSGPLTGRILIGAGGGAAVVVLVVAMLLVSRSRRARSGQERTAVAEALDLVYEEKPPKDFLDGFGPLPGIPSRGTIGAVFTGDIAGRALTVFSHMYMIHTGQASFPVNHTVYVTSAPPWPPVTIKPRHRLGKLLFRLGVRRGLLLEEDAFNALFSIKTEDEDFALTLLRPDLQLFLATKPDITWKINPGGVAMIYAGALDTDRMNRSIERLSAFWDLIPEELEAW